MNQVAQVLSIAESNHARDIFYRQKAASIEGPVLSLEERRVSPWVAGGIPNS